MEFKIKKVNNRGKEQFEIWYLDEFDNRGLRWQKVIWDEESYCRFRDNNFTDTIDEAKQKAVEFKKKYEEENGTVIEQFIL